MSQPLSLLLGHTGEFSGKGLESFTHGLSLSSSPDQVRNYWKPPLEDPKGKSWFIKPKITIFQVFGRSQRQELVHKAQDHNFSSLWPEASPLFAQGASLLSTLLLSNLVQQPYQPVLVCRAALASLHQQPCHEGTKPQPTLHSPRRNYLPTSIYSELMTTY